jgi:hypothetical protein
MDAIYLAGLISVDPKSIQTVKSCLQLALTRFNLCRWWVAAELVDELVDGVETFKARGGWSIRIV